MQGTTWRERLTRARQAERLSRPQLAELANVSESALKAYERGTRDPSRAALVALIEALKLGLLERNEILFSAGFAPDGAALAPSDPGFNFSIEEAKAYMEARSWPMALMAETMEVVWANRLLQRIWDVDLDRELNEPVERNILAVITLPRFEGRLVNWGETVTLGLAGGRGSVRRSSTPAVSSGGAAQITAPGRAGYSKQGSRMK